MLTRRWEPIAEMNRLRNEMERVFGRYGNGQRSMGGDVYPPLNIWEDVECLFVEAEMPGFEMNDLEIYVTGGNQLSLKGERKAPVFEGGVRHRQERAYGSFNRTIELPTGVDSDKVSADLRDGVLTITLPKSAEAKPRRIEVKAG